jgi:hypothetical protein
VTDLKSKYKQWGGYTLELIRRVSLLRPGLPAAEAEEGQLEFLEKANKAYVQISGRDS